MKRRLVIWSVYSCPGLFCPYQVIFISITVAIFQSSRTCPMCNKKLNNDDIRTNPLAGKFLNMKLVMWSWPIAFLFDTFLTAYLMSYNPYIFGLSNQVNLETYESIIRYLYQWFGWRKKCCLIYRKNVIFVSIRNH